MDHFLCEPCGLFTRKTPFQKHFLFSLTMLNPVTGWLETVKSTYKLAISIHCLLHIF